MILGFGAASEVSADFVDRMCAAHQSTKGGGVKLFFG
jgi:hypothetical protein